MAPIPIGRPERVLMLDVTNHSSWSSLSRHFFSRPMWSGEVTKSPRKNMSGRCRMTNCTTSWRDPTRCRLPTFRYPTVNGLDQVSMRYGQVRLSLIPHLIDSMARSKSACPTLGRATIGACSHSCSGPTLQPCVSVSTVTSWWEGAGQLVLG